MLLCALYLSRDDYSLIVAANRDEFHRRPTTG
ncbi:NRDE family protein [Aestuariibacter sp. A3R04]|nr:NRDE family protein [Aestuariibacter sp. A3R04]